MKSLFSANILAAAALILVSSYVSITVAASGAWFSLWSTKIKSSSAIGYGVAYENAFYVQAQDTGDKQVTLYKLDLESGALLWSKSTPSSTGLYVAAGNGNIYAGTTDALTAYEASSGDVSWTYKTTTDMHSSALPAGWPGKPTFMNGVVYVTWYNTPMVAINATTGKELFRTDYYVGGRIWNVDELNEVFFMSQSNTTLQYSSTKAPGFDATLAASSSATQAVRPYKTTWDATGNFDTCVANEHGMASRVFTNSNSSWAKTINGLSPKNLSILWTVNGTDLTANGGFDYNIMKDRVCMSWENTNSTYILTCHDITSGERMWAVDLPTTDNSINVAAGDDFVLVYGYTSGEMFAFDYDGNPIWTMKQRKPWYGTVHNKTYYFGHYDNVDGTSRISAVNAEEISISGGSEANIPDNNGDGGATPPALTDTAWIAVGLGSVVVIGGIVLLGVLLRPTKQREGLDEDLAEGLNPDNERESQQSFGGEGSATVFS